MVARGMLKVATAVSHYPFYNFRYLKLLQELSKVFDVYVFAWSKLKTIREKNKTFKLCYTLPFIIPRRIKYYVGPLITQPFLNLIGPDVAWLFDTAISLTPLIIEAPIILDVDDPKFTPSSKFSLIGGHRLMRDRGVKKVVVPTSIIKEKLVKFFDISEDKVEVIPNGVDLELFKPSELPGEDIVLYYGTLAPHRSRFLARVVEEVLKLKRDVKFIIIGDAPIWLKKFFIDRDIIDDIIMPGYIKHDSLPRWVTKAKVCIFTQDVSLGGRLSIKLLEYMASGRPIVATDVDEAWPIKESSAGIVSPLDPAAFAEAVVKLLEDKELARKLAENGIKYARKYDWREIAKRYAQLMKEAARS
jgi:glycosyltransferase involved in cell wall biosynthesis